MPALRRAQASSCLRRTTDGTFVPMYACGGVRPVNTGVAIFPIGGVEAGQACPAREICAWYAEYNFGDTIEYIDQPESSMLQPAFKVTPFSCRHYFDHAHLVKAKQQVSPSNKKGRVAPALRVLPDLPETPHVSLVELARHR